MVHPDAEIRKRQADFLNSCPASEKEFHAQLFRIGNAAFLYHQCADAVSDEIAESYFIEWLTGLPDNIRIDMEKKGFERCKSILPFTRFVNERRDIGMDEWMKEHLSEIDYKAYKCRDAFPGH